MSEPIHVISLGAGVQSSTMALMAAKGEITPMPKGGIFADTQGEPESVYRWLSFLCGVEVKFRTDGEPYVEPGIYTSGKLSFPVHIVTAGKLEEFATTEKTNRKTGNKYYSNCIPAFVKNAGTQDGGRVGRYCTRDFKVYPIIREVKRICKSEIATWRRERNENKRTARILAGAFSGAGSPRDPEPVVIQWIGISRDEISRMKPSRDAFIKHRWPLIEKEMTRNACLKWMDAHGFLKPPRSACRFCPFKSNHEWRKLRDEEPVEFARAVAFEVRLQAFHASIVTPGKTKGIPFLHRKLVPLDQVDFSTEEERGQESLFDNQFNNECEGLCGV